MSMNLDYSVLSIARVRYSTEGMMRSYRAGTQRDEWKGKVTLAKMSQAGAVPLPQRGFTSCPGASPLEKNARMKSPERT